MIWLTVLPAALGAGWLLGGGDAATNLRAALQASPIHLLAVLQGVTVGLYGRERIRLRRAYASPTLAYLGKRLFLAALTGAATFAGSPVDWAASSLHAFAASAALGAAMWVGNLPSRL